MTAPVAASLDTALIDRVEDLEQLADEWTALWEQCPVATPFQLPEWLLPWCRCFSPRGLRVLVYRQDGELAGLVPMTIEEDRDGRRIALLGMGISDYLDALIRPDAVDAALDELLAYLSDGGLHAGPFEFRPLPTRGTIATGLQRKGLGNCLSPEREPCPVLPLDADARNMSEQLPSQQAKKLAYYRRRLHRTGAAAVETANHDNLEKFLSSLVRLHAARWNERGSPGVLADPTIQRFHREAAHGMLARNVLRMHGLCLGGRLLAIYYGFAAHGRSYYYLSGFDPAASRLSPGMLIVGHAIEEAWQEGSVAFDFLRGREPYKYAWGAEDQATCRWRYPP